MPIRIDSIVKRDSENGSPEPRLLVHNWFEGTLPTVPALIMPEECREEAPIRFLRIGNNGISASFSG